MLIATNTRQPAACLNWQHILKWYFLKYHQVYEMQVFSDPVSYSYLYIATVWLAPICRSYNYNKVQIFRDFTDDLYWTVSKV